MSSYCSVADVEDLTGFDYDDSSQPTETDVEEIITDISSEIDSVLLAASYSLPVTDTDALALLKRYGKLGSAYTAWYAGVDNESEPAHVASWKEDYKAFLKRLASGKAKLPETTPVSAPGGMASVMVGRSDGYSAAADSVDYA